jgi:L-ascorbate metabolism protein UlaG (beta-lactamase superfamily)
VARPGKLRLSSGAGFRIGLRHERLINTLNPFVAEVAARARATPFPEAVLAAAQLFPQLAGHCDLPRSARDLTFGLRDSLMFPEHEGVEYFFFDHRRARSRLTLTVEDPTLVGEVGALLRAAADDSLGVDDDRFGETLPGLLEAFEEAGIISDAREPAQLRLPDGITRLQHAALAVKDGSDLLLVDPNLNSWFDRNLETDLPLADLPGAVSAIAISHSHDDHFHLPTLMLFPRDTPIIVPRVDTANLLCPNLDKILRQCGFTNVLSPPWYGPPIRFGNLEVTVYPFFGEQPLPHEPWRDQRLRNWGNTYHVQTSAMSCFILIDSGNDPRGRMADVAGEIVEAKGPVDVILSNLREFHVGRGTGLPFYITGAGHYWFSLNPEQMASFDGLSDQCITLGPLGAAEVARRCRARYVLPYAHWWQIPGQPLTVENEQLAVIAQATGKGATDMIGWSVGDSYSPGPGGRLIHRSYAPGQGG